MRANGPLIDKRPCRAFKRVLRGEAILTRVSRIEAIVERLTALGEVIV